MYSTPNFTVYVPKRGGKYLIQRFMEHPEFGYSQATGEFIEMSRETMLNDCQEVVSRLLAEYLLQRDLGLPPEAKMSAAKKRQFHDGYFTVVVNLVAKDTLTLAPINMDEAGDSGLGCDDHAIMLSMPFTPQQFIEAIDAAAKHNQC